MVVADHQPVITRDFLGLGKLVVDDPEGLEEGTSGQPRIFPSQGLHPSSSSMDLPGIKQPVCNIGLSMEHSFPVKKSPEESFIEGTAESHGWLANATQWQGIGYGTNTTLDATPASVLGSEAIAKPNVTQLTIFYGGHVNVYNNISADKAQELMHVAANSNLSPLNESVLPIGISHALGAPGYSQLQRLAENHFINAQNGDGGQVMADQASHNCPSKLFECAMPSTPSSASSPQPVVPRALPLARKASLARFFERRKERMQLMMPYLKKQFPPTQGPSSTGDYMPGPFHGEMTLAKLYEEFYRRPSAAVFGMQEHLAPHNDVPLRGISTKE